MIARNRAAHEFGDGAPSDTIAVIPPPALVPKLTTNSAHIPTAVDRTAWIRYVSLVAPAGTVPSTNFFTPAPPRTSNSTDAPTAR